MGRRFFPILVFGVLTFAIPLLILPSETGNVPLLPVGNLTQGMQEKSENPAKKQEQAEPAEEEKTERTNRKEVNEFDVEKYRQKVFSMYGGEEQDTE